MNFNEKKLLGYENLQPENSNDETEAENLPFNRNKNYTSLFGREPPDFFPDYEDFLDEKAYQYVEQTTLS